MIIVLSIIVVLLIIDTVFLFAIANSLMDMRDSIAGREDEE